MKVEFETVGNKPDKWPANAIECQLDNIQKQMEMFKKNPNYKNKEVLISLVNDYDLNQRSAIGLFRTTEYEVAIINSLFVESYLLQFNSLKVYLYELVSLKTRMQKILSWFPEASRDIEVKEFLGLFPQLKLHYLAYQKFTVENNKSYAEQLIEVVEGILDISDQSENIKEKEEIIYDITKAYISLINDISYFRCVKRTKIWAFTHEEIYKIYKLVAKLAKINGDLPTKRPLKGVLMTSISNYILKSRNNYNEDYICKYISSEVAKQSISNHQIWMSIIERLNDEREQKVIPELFKETEWIDYSWVKDIDFSAKRNYYVSSFCKSLNNTDMMKNYGECVYGYKDDRIAEIIAPILYYNKKSEKRIPVFSQVIAFDVIYNIDEAKEELKFLCSIIDCFDMKNEEKKIFLEEILQYWILSVKDPKWKYERERRYVLFMYDNYDYEEIDLSDSRFLKLKTSLFIEPDFILGKNPVKWYIKMMVDNKRKAISMKQYLFCEECFNRDFDIVAGNNNINKCPICGSKNIKKEEPHS